MFRQKKWMIICLVTIFTMVAFSSAFGADQVLEEISLTKKQISELEKAKKETQRLKEEWSKREKPTFHEDKKMKSSNGTDDITIQSSGSFRSGIYLVTLDSSSTSSSAWAGGHAGIVGSDTSKAVESFANKSPMGVQYWPNDWTTRYSHFTAYTVDNTTISQDEAAASKAVEQIGKPYNLNFWYPDIVSGFYCSQLVYYSFKSTSGVNLNYDGGPVWPVDLARSPKSIAIYSK